VVVVAGATGTSVLAGWLIATGHAALVAALIGAAGLPVAFRRYPSPTAAILLLAIMNGLPFLNLGGRLPGGAHYQDGAVVLLTALLFYWRGRPLNVRHARLIRLARGWSVVFVSYWLFTLVRSVEVYAVPWIKAGLYGRDFLYFAVLLPLALRARFPAGSVRVGVKILAAGVAAFAVGVLLTSGAGLNAAWLTHPTTVSVTSGVSRVYSPMGDLVNTSLIVAVAVLLSRHARGRRPVVTCVVGLLLVASLLQLTRANYFALAVAACVSGYLYVAHYASVGSLIVRGVMLVLAVLALALSIHGATGVTQSGNSALGAVISRVQNGASDIAQSGGTFGYRQRVDGELLAALGPAWPDGLSFLHPDAHYVVGVPEGTIRNSDTGVLNVVMTMGALGALLLYAPVLYALVLILRLTRRGSASAPQMPAWIAYTAAGWLAWALAGSPTLIVLFSVSGLVLSALVLGALGQAVSAVPARAEVGVARRSARAVLEQVHT
jgi:hypothetical protein